MRYCTVCGQGTWLHKSMEWCQFCKRKTPHAKTKEIVPSSESSDVPEVRKQDA